MEQFYYILETFQILWPNQQSIKNFALYEEKSNCETDNNYEIDHALKICQIFHQKKNQKVLMKIEEMADVFLNSANFASHAFLTLAPPSGYALNLKALIKVSKVSWTSQLSYEMLRSSLERQFDKTNFISPKRTPPKSPHRLGLNKYLAS